MISHSMNSVQTDGLLTEKKVAEILCCSTPLLRKWRNLGLGPRYCKIGRYAATDIEVFVKESYKEVA